MLHDKNVTYKFIYYDHELRAKRLDPVLQIFVSE